jgi:hypothetical protein
MSIEEEDGPALTANDANGADPSGSQALLNIL